MVAEGLENRKWDAYSQLTSFLNRSQFNDDVRKYHGRSNTSKSRSFGGTNENSVRIQICAAIIAYCLVAIIQHDMHLERSTYEVLQLLSISLMDKTPLQDLFNKTNFNNVKEQIAPLIADLFD